MFPIKFVRKWICTNCKSINDSDSSPNSCASCGDPRGSDEGDFPVPGAGTARAYGDMYCPSCGRVYPDGTTHCNFCPASQQAHARTTSDRQGDYYYCANCGATSSSPGACPYCSNGRQLIARSGAPGPVGEDVAIYQCLKCFSEFRYKPSEKPTFCPTNDGGILKHIGVVSGGAERGAPGLGHASRPIAVRDRQMQGCLLETRSAAAPLFRPRQGSVPERVDLRQHCSPVEDQGQTNSCTANAIVGALEYHQRRMTGGSKDMSRLFVYFNARKMSDTQGEDCGSFIHHVMASVMAHGACEERLWPFESGAITVAPDKSTYQNAELHEAISYARTPLGVSCLEALASGLPVVFGTYLPQRFYQEAEKTGVMPLPAERVEPPAGGHAMLIVGYDMTARHWLVRNSWGEGWGERGYVRIPFETLEAYSSPDHFWTIGAIEKMAPGATIGAPLKMAMKSAHEDARADVREALSRLRSSAKPLGEPYAIYMCPKCYAEYKFRPDEKPNFCPTGDLGLLRYVGPAAGGSPQIRTPGERMSTPASASMRGYKGAPLPTSARRLDGCLFETRRSNAPLVQTPMGNVPNAIDLRQYCSPVEDQGRSNSCTANATVGALEYHQRRTGGAFTDISRLFVYYNSRQLAGAQSEDCGSFIHHSMAAVLAHGACEENVWPFDLAQVLAQPPQNAYQNGGQHEAVQYGRTLLGNPVIQALAAGLPVVFGTYAPSRFYDEAGQSGVMPAPAEKLDPPGGGHAMLIVGYDLPSKTWLVRNSWGEGWADKGYFRAPFATLEAYSYPDHFWAIGAIESKQGLSLSGPSPMQAAQAVRAEAAGELREALAKLRGDLRSDFQSELDRQKADIRDRLRNPDKT